MSVGRTIEIAPAILVHSLLHDVVHAARLVEGLTCRTARYLAQWTRHAPGKMSYLARRTRRHERRGKHEFSEMSFAKPGELRADHGTKSSDPARQHWLQCLAGKLFHQVGRSRAHQEIGELAAMGIAGVDVVAKNRLQLAQLGIDRGIRIQ